MIDLLIRVGTVITVDRDRRVITDGAVAVDQGRITAVGPAADIDESARRRIEMPHGVALPGLVDAHGHAGHSLIRTMADDLGLWMRACEAVYLHGATPDFWYAEARLTAAERLLAGTTTALSLLGGAGDTVRADDAAHGDGHLRGATEVGMRSVLAVGPGAPPFPKTTTSPGGEVLSSFDDQLAVVEELAAVWPGRVALTYPTLAMADVSDETAPGAATVADVSDRLGLRVVQDGHRDDTVDASAEFGLLTERSVLSHAVDLTDRHIELIAESGASVAHNPSAIFSQFGRCPVPELLEAGVTVGLGSDATAPDRSVDMFRHMFQLTRYHRADRRDPALLPPGTALEMTTRGSAHLMGLGDEIGSLEPGKAADIVVVDAAKPHLTPFTHPVHQLVYFATGADVDTVIAGGDVVVEGRRLARVDVEDVMEAAEREQALAFERVGLDVPSERSGLWGAVRYPDGPGVEL